VIEWTAALKFNHSLLRKYEHSIRQKIEQDTRLREHKSNHLYHSAYDGAVSSPEISAEKITTQKDTEQCAILNHLGGQS